MVAGLGDGGNIMAGDKDSMGRDGAIPELAPDVESGLESIRLRAIDETLDESERRRSSRAPVYLPVSLDVLSESGGAIGAGRAVLRDLSIDGAYIANIEIREADQQAEEIVRRDSGKLSVVLRFQVLDGELAGMIAHCQPVRVSRSFDGIGVKLRDGFHFEL